MQMQQSGWFQSDRRTAEPGATQEQDTEAHDDPVQRSEIRAALSASIADLKLMFDKDRFGHNGTETSRQGESNEDDDDVNEKYENFAHPAHDTKGPQTLDFFWILGIRQGQVAQERQVRLW